MNASSFLICLSRASTSLISSGESLPMRLAIPSLKRSLANDNMLFFSCLNIPLALPFLSASYSSLRAASLGNAPSSMSFLTPSNTFLPGVLRIITPIARPISRKLLSMRSLNAFRFSSLRTTSEFRRSLSGVRASSTISRKAFTISYIPRVLRKAVITCTTCSMRSF